MKTIKFRLIRYPDGYAVQIKKWYGWKFITHTIGGVDQVWNEKTLWPEQKTARFAANLTCAYRHWRSIEYPMLTVKEY